MNTQRLVAGAGALLLALSVTGCGGSNQPATTSGGDAPAEQTATYSHDALLSPDKINPGWVLDSDNNVGGTSDLWLPAKEGATESLYFTKAANDAGLDVTFVDDKGTEDGVWDLEISEDHLKTLTGATDKRKVDITFQDDFTCYDAVSDTTYTRGIAPKEDYEALFAGKAFVADKAKPEDRMMNFAEDGTVTLTTGDKVANGTWRVTAVNVVEVHFASDTSEWDDEYRVILDEGNNPAELDEGSSTNLVIFEG